MMTTKWSKHVRKPQQQVVKRKMALVKWPTACGMNSEPAVNGTKMFAAVYHRKNCRRPE
jgi:hypothetical protein